MERIKKLFGKKEGKRQQSAKQAQTSTSSLKETEELFKLEEEKSKIESIRKDLEEIKKTLPQINEYSIKLEEKVKEMTNKVGKYKQEVQNLEAQVNELYKEYDSLRPQLEEAIKRYKTNLNNLVKANEEYESLAKKLGEIEKVTSELKMKIEKDMEKVKAFSTPYGEVIAKILKNYKSIKDWEKFKGLLAYTPEILKTTLEMCSTDYSPDELLPIAAAYFLNKCKEKGDPFVEIAKYVNPKAVEDYLISLSNKSREASIQISSLLEK
jgi:chromosome segregation ATPase